MTLLLSSIQLQITAHQQQIIQETLYSSNHQNSMRRVQFIQKRRVIGTHIITTTQHWGTPEPPALNSDHLHIMIT
ncbi:hypothetical protein Csa_001847 [Cucumis sativus]|uniref:Uncharacterized protein n=1 Tax=Cucumis sativus TaxID=3659 RepID=A0A0A0LJD6_CUCSA|nr:hypothetical protein Csa_001847 [Cucumis sativus]